MSGAHVPKTVLLASALWALPILPGQDSVASAGGDALERILAGGEPADPAELRAMQEHVQSLLDEVLPAVVSLGGATGVLVGDGYVLTAGHVSRSAGRTVHMTLHDGRRIEGETLGANLRTDTGLVRITTQGEFPSRPMGRSAELERGAWCLMLGHPSGPKEGRSAPARLGRVLRVPERGYLVTDCTMQAGDSGGPLFDMEGRVIGINSRISASLAHNMHVPIDAFHAEWDKLVAGEVVQAERSGRRGRGRVGFGVELDRDAEDARVLEVAEGSPAAKAGIRAGDVIVGIDEAEVNDRRDLFRALLRRRPGDEAVVKVRRGDESLEFRVELERSR